MPWFLVSGGVPAEEVACDQMQEDNGYGASAASTTGTAQYSTSLYRASRFTYNGINGKQICSVDISVKFVGASSHTYYLQLRSDDGSGKPGSVIGTSDGYDLLSAGAAFTTFTMVFSTPSSSLANGTTYHLALYSPTNDTSNYAVWDNSATGDMTYLTLSEDGTTWSEGLTTRTYIFELYSQ